MAILDSMIDAWLYKAVSDLEGKLHSDVIFFKGPIDQCIIDLFYSYIKKKIDADSLNKRLSIILHTNGGSVEPVEKTVEIIRKYYKFVDFIVTEAAMSAGTIFCMSGDRIFMSPKSSLGPIDPQVLSSNGKFYVPALGYLEQFKKLIEKSKNNDITPAEIDLLRRIDLGDINMYEQASNLTVTLLKKWLVEYKFKNWKIHHTDPLLKGKEVTIEEKRIRAEKIATILGDNTIWHAHGRYISMDTLRKVLRLKIEDYTLNKEKCTAIDTYNSLCIDYIFKNGYSTFMHSSLGVIAWR